LLRMFAVPPSSGTIRRLALLSILALPMFACWVGIRRSPVHRLVPYAVALLMLIAAATMPGCGGSSGTHTGSGGTPTGSYNLTVTGTFTSGSTTLTHTTKLTLNVQRVD
jgi:hypothetical protein